MTVFTPLIGRFGNQAFQFCYAKRFCELNGHTLATPPWVGEKIFDIPEAVRTENPDMVLGEYRQAQKDLIYSRKWCKETLRLKPEVEEKFKNCPLHHDVAAHRRVGDYAGCGYPVVSEGSYYKLAFSLGYHPHDIDWVTEEEPYPHPEFTKELAFLPDFYRLMQATVLLRGNSSFSFWAAVLSSSDDIYAPVIEGLEGGREHDCTFVRGNWPRLANLDFTTDLHLSE